MADLILVDANLDALAMWAAALRGTHFSVSLVEAVEPTQTARRMAALRPAAILVGLSGDESVVDLRNLLDTCTETRVLLLAPRMPVRAAFARVADRSRAVILSREEPPIVIASTVVAILASDTRAAHG
jgi:hypothetical protein